MAHQSKDRSRKQATCVSKKPHFSIFKKVMLKSLYENCQAYPWFPEVLALVRADDWGGVFAWSERAVTVVYDSAAEHFAVAQMSALVRKFPFHWETLGLPVSPREQATMTFLDAERRCRKINKLFARIRRTKYSFRLEYMRRWIAHVLGDKPDLLAIYDKCDFGSGSNLGVHGNATNIYRKLFAESWTVTRTALPYALGALKRNNNLSLHLYDTSVDGQYVCFDSDVLDERLRSRMQWATYNKLSFVPKTAKTERVIAVEPLLNSFVQKGIDSVMRDKLRRHGYDLRDQGRNQYLAKVGSENGLLATMDLSSASDSISTELVRYLLPAEWHELLSRVRCANYELHGEIHYYEKFCSMGNGFCFPLETLIFAAAARAVMHDRHDAVRTHAVYGDDIIVPTDCYDDLKKLLGLMGFKTNSRKSFKSGPFRESCGADWYKGQDVRPVYLDYPLANDVSLRIFHNATLRGDRTDTWFNTIRPYLREQVSAEHRFLRPHLKRFTADGGWGGLTRDEKFIVVANLNGAFEVEMDTFMASRWARWHRGQQSWNWKEYLYTPYEDRVVNPDSLYHRGRYLAFLRGSPEGRLALRRKTRVSVINIITDK